MEIKDSGNRRAFDTGAVRDMSEGKGRMDLLPWEAIIEVSKHCENGAKKYGEHNVDKGIPTHSLCDSAARHLAKYLSGWDDEPHLLAATWNLLWAVQMTVTHPEMVDTPFENNVNKSEEHKMILSPVEHAYQNLANAIVKQAVEDYRKALRGKSYRHDKDPAPVITEIEKFFKSDYFEMLTKVKGDFLIEKLRKEYEENKEDNDESNIDTSNA